MEKSPITFGATYSEFAPAGAAKSGNGVTITHSPGP
jgi:hypothetical protein